MELQDLIDEVERESSSDDPLDRLRAAIVQYSELTEKADELLDHFVHAARQAGRSWAQVGEVLGVTKQAAQQRHGPGREPSGWFRKARGQLFNRFTPRARNALAEAENEARALGHNYVGTEHLLLGLFKDDQAVAPVALARWNVDRDYVHHEVVQLIGQGSHEVSGDVPFTPRSKKALELTLGQALGMGHNYIGTEHILLGLIAVEDGLAAKILRQRDVNLDNTRQAVIEILLTKL